MINRAALLLYYKPPFVEWLNQADPDSDPITLEEANADKVVYLIDDLEAENLDEWIGLNHQALFETELAGWFDDEASWPENRDLELFHRCFEVRCHTILIDAGVVPIADDTV